MPAPTLQELFGTGASLSGNTLSLDLGNFVSVGFDATAPTAARIAAALIKQWRIASNGKLDDPEFGITIDQPFASLTQRGTATQRAYQYPVSFYIPDDAAPEPDPDSVV